MSFPRRLLTLAVLLLAAATLGGVFAVAQAQEAEGAINGLTLSSDSPGTLTVSWDTPSPAPSDYRVRWAQAESDYLSWKDDNETDRGNEYPAGDATSLTLSGLSEGTEYKVQVRARYNDGAHKDSPWSGPWTEELRGRVMSQPADVPSAPAAPNIVGTAATPEGHVMLVWQDPSDDSITGYQVLRGPDADNLVVIEEDTGSSGTSYTDMSPPAGRTHTYAVKARNAAGLSPPSNTVTATVPEAEEEEEEELITSQQNSDAILVSNLGQMNVGTGRVSSSQEIAQAFVAGPGLASFGYRFEGIRVSAARDTLLFPSTIPQARASLHGDAGGLPGALLHTLTVPDDFASTGAFTDYTLSAPPGTVLPGGARYWVVFEILSADLLHRTTSSTAEDQAPPPVDGWFIDNERYVRVSGGVWQSGVYSIKLAVLGEPEWDTSEPASEPADGDLPADTTTRGLLVVDGAGVTGTHFSYDDVDWYVVELEADTDYEFRGVNTTPHSRLHVLKVHNHEGEEQSSSLIEFNTSRGQYEHVERLNKLPYKTSTAGTYYVSIEPWNYGSGAEKVYTLTARSDDSPDCRTGERPAGESFRLCATGTDPVDHPGVTLDPARVLPIAISVGDIAISARDEAESYIMRTGSDSTSSNTDDADMFRVLLNKNILYRFEWDVACVHEGIILGIFNDNHDPQVSETSVSRIHNTCDNVIVEFTPTVTTFYNVIVSARGSQFPVSGRDRSPRARYPFLGVRGTLTVIDTTAPPPNSPAKGDPLARGERKVGATLAADTVGITDADGLTDPMFTYQWQRDDGGAPADISGATSDTYTLTDDDVGKRIRLQVQFTDDGGFSETRTGPATSLVVPAPHILVGNLSQRASVGATYDVSTAFITGTHPLGYALDSVHMNRHPNTAGSNSLAEFRLYDSYSGSNLDRLKPAGTRLVTASGPDNVSGEVLTFLPPNVKLDPATTYHVVLTGSQGPSIGCRSGSNSLDSGSLAGFNIANQVWNYPAASFQGLRGCAFRLYGFEMVSSKFVEKVEFTSSPAQVGMYATGEVIEATATLSEAVTFDGPPPELPLQVGDEERQMTYVESASTPTSWVFRYTVVAGDRDDNGVSIERNALQGYADAGLSHNHLKDQSDHNVNAAPRIVSRQVSSRPVAPNWYGPGEQIQFTVGFSLPVTVVGDPQLEFNVTTPGPQNEFASYLSGSGTTELVFSYTVGAGDDDSDGIWWGADSLRLDSDDAITSVYNSLEPVLDHTALGTRSSHRIDQNPRAVSQQVTSHPTRGANSDTYGAGDAITFEVVFNQMVTVTGGPRLRFNIGSGSGDEYASYVSGSGTDTLVFSYTVLAADADTDGIYRYNNPLDYPDAATDSIVGEDNSLPAENEGIGRTGALSGHKVDGAITSGLRAVEVQFGAASYTATEGGSAVTVTVALSADPERTVTAPLEVTVGGGATAGDYTLSADSVTFDAGDTSAEFTVTAPDDTDNDDGESITIGFGTLPDGVTAASPDSTTVSLVDDDFPAVTVRFLLPSFTATEGGSEVTVPVELSADPERTVTVDLEVTAGGGATASDYTLSADSVTFHAGDTSAEFTVTAADDTDNDDGESITIGFGTLPDGVTAASPDSTTVSLLDDDFPAVTVRFDQASYTATEGGSAVTVTVTLSADPERTVTVDLEVTAGGGATASDYTLSADSVTFDAGDTSATFTVTAADDTDNDDGESITIGFGTLPDGVTAASPDSTTVSLLDDDFPAVTVRFDQASYTATEGGSAVTVTVTLSADPEGTVTVDLEVTAGGGATASDYTLSADSVTFDAGDTSATFTVTAADDTDNDDGESITIGFGTLPDGVTAASPDSTTVSLLDDDFPAVTVQFDQFLHTAVEGSTVTVTVSLSADPERTVTVDLEETHVNDATTADYTLSATSVTFAAGETTAEFTVTAVDDDIDDDGEELLFGFATPLPDGVTAGPVPHAAVELVDNDDPAVTVRFDQASYTATEGGTAATVTVTLSADPERTVTAPLEVTAGGGATAGDYTLSADSVTFDAGDTSAEFTVTAADDTDDDDGESITIGFGTLPDRVTAASPDSTTVSLVDNDNSPAQGDPLPRGEREVDATLTADTSGITDADGLADAMFAYQWQRVDGGAPADISGETSDTYTLTDEDVGKRIRLRVRFTDDGGTPETLTGPATSLVVPEPRILVGNLSRIRSVNSPTDASTGFVTGTHPLGYAIESIEMTRNDTTFVSSAFGEFRLYASTVNSDPLDRKPDRASRLVTVSGPDGVSGSVLTFGALSRVKLDPGATYHAVLTRSAGGAIGCSLALSGLDSGSLAGFSIIPRSWDYPGANGNSAGCRLRIRGFELVSSSFVEKVEFTSSPAQAGMYATGEAIEATVTLSEAVTFADPSPVLLLQIGANVREMTYVASASTATSWVFRYTVAAGDRDDEGVSIERNALRGYADADLSHRGIASDLARQVNAAPRVVARRVSSRPVAPNWYGPGEHIEFTVEFSLPVTVVGDPQLEFNVTTPGPQSEFASYLRGSGTTELVFSYTVGAGDDDPDGIWSGADSLRLDGDDSITGVYNGLDAVLDHSALGTRSSHRIDQNPRVVSQKVTSDPAQGTNSDTYGAGDAITFEVVFNQTVTVTGDPRLRFNIGSGSGDEYASYVSGSGTDTLVFSYTVLAADADTDGIYLFGDPFTLETGESILGADNSLPAVNAISGADRAVGGHKIDGSITGGLRAVEVRFGAASYTATEGGSAATVTVTLSTDPERTVTAPLEVTAGGGATAGDYTLSADSVTFDAGDTSAEFTVTAADDTDDDDGESITIGFGTLPDRVTAASPDSTTVSLVDNDNSPAQGDPLPRGEREVDATLTADTSGITDADGLADAMFAYQWQRVDGGAPADISGETSDTYTLTDEDVGKRIRLRVRFTDDGGTPETLTGPATSLVVPEPRILVGNLSQFQAISVPSDASTGFVTGTHPLGYAIESIQMARNSTTFVSSAFGEFRLYASTVNSDPLNRKPDRASRLVTVSGPDSVSGNVLTFAPSRVKLDPGATYHAVLTRSQGGTIGCSLAGSGLDSGSLAGFSIIPRSWDYPRANGTSAGCRLRIRGFELVSSSFVEKVEFTSSPALAGMYATGEVIEATATLSEAVTFAEPSPVLLLQIGANEREMTYVASASTATSWVFRYTVAADDRDDDGVSIKRNALRGYADADLSHRGIDNDRERHVNAAPRVVSRGVTSRPVAPNWYGPGEQIQFTVGFSLPVTVVGDPQLEFNVTTPGPQSEFATYVRGSGTTELVFSYTVGAGDDDPDGIFLGPDSLRLDSDDAITSVYNGLDAVLDHSRAGALTRHKIDQNPRAVSQEVTSNPTRGANSDTYGAGDAITFEVVFNQTVTVTGDPRLRFNIGSGSGDEYASYVSGSGTDTLVFSYTVLAADADTDGIYRYNNPLDYPGTATIVGTANSLAAENQGIGRTGALSGHKVDGAITN